ncbi:MAG: EpsI family protein [Burkholderiales bacterium]|nr:EpsI family protein [Burkholderiales bacterium]
MLIAGSMAAISVVGFASRPSQRIADHRRRGNLKDFVPRAFGHWREDELSNVILPSPDAQATIDKIYNEVLARTYLDSKGRRIMLSIAYGGDKGEGGMSIHRPEVCYPAQGFRVEGQRSELLTIVGRTIPVKRLRMALGERHEPVTYWIVIGDIVVASGIEQKLIEMRYGTQGLIPDGYLFRVSSIDRDPEQGWLVQESFIRELAAALTPAAQTNLFGALDLQAVPALGGT